MSERPTPEQAAIILEMAALAMTQGYRRSKDSIRQMATLLEYEIDGPSFALGLMSAIFELDKISILQAIEVSPDFWAKIITAIEKEDQNEST